MKRILVVLMLWGLLPVGFAQEKLDKPVFPEGYEQWPHIFHRHLDLGNQKQFNFTVWVKQYGGKGTEVLFVEEIDGVSILVMHYAEKEGKPNSSLHVLVRDGYLRVSDQDQPPVASMDELLDQNEVVLKRFGLDDAALQKMEDFRNSCDEDLSNFFANLAKGGKP